MAHNGPATGDFENHDLKVRFQADFSPVQFQQKTQKGLTRFFFQFQVLFFDIHNCKKTVR